MRQCTSLWNNAINLGENINSKGWDGYASISPDDKYLFYSSNKNGNYQLYWVNISIIDKIKSEEFKKENQP